jgi:DNA-directed RNA polymerase subunit M/transcription elongation factor TFIIS
MNCPKCKSPHVILEEYQGLDCIVCNDCGYDESQQYEVYPEHKSSQKAKGKFNVYKSGGKNRTKK